MATTTSTLGQATGSARPEIDDKLRARIAEGLIGKFKGAVIGPDHPEYDAARTVWNAMVDKRPGLILRCTCTEDVVTAIKVARAHNLRPTVRGGGHNVAGKAISDGGLTIDMTGMREVSVDKANMRVHVGGGCMLGDADKECAKHGVIVPAGVMSETGVAGLALGGGIGWFSRKHGLTCDNFHEIELVTADGDVVRANANDHAELFWALRGGGGNFGIVTKFTFKCYEFGPNIRIGAALFHPEDTAQALREYSKLNPTLPRHVGWHVALKDAMPKLPFVPPELVGKRMAMFIVMWLNDEKDPAAVEMIEKLNSIGKPAVKAMTVMPFAAGLQKVIDEEFENGHRYYTKEAHMETLPDEAIDKMVAFWKDMPMQGEIEIIHLGGAIKDVAEADAAFSNRGYQFWLNFAMRWDGAENDADYMGRSRQIVAELGPWVGKGIYVNMLNFDENDRIVEAYGGPEKYVRLGHVKGQYDPDNFFRANANIAPLPKPSA